MSEYISPTVDVRSLKPAVDDMSREGLARPDLQDVLSATREVLACLGADYPNGANPAEFARIILSTAVSRSVHSSEASATMRLCGGVLHGLLEPGSKFGDAAWQAILEAREQRENA